MEEELTKRGLLPTDIAYSSKGILLILVATAIVFLNSLRNGFVWDDWVLIVYNDVYTSFDIRTIFFAKANSLEYLPVRDITLAIDARLWGMKPFGFHLTNLLLYLISLVALFRMVRNVAVLLGEEKGDFVAFWSTLVFALHPLHAEVVNFVAARNNILAGLFIFLSFNFFFEGLYGKKDSSLLLSAFFFILALFSKASAAFYPLFLFVVLLILPRSIASVRKKLLLLVLFLTIDGIVLWVHITVASSTTLINDAIVRFGVHNVIVALSKAVQIPIFYAKKLLLPYPMSIEYPVSFETAGSTLTLLFFPLCLLFAFFMIRCWTKGHRLPVLGALWYLLSLGPVLNIFPTSPVVADRYAYFAVLGFGIVLAAILNAVPAKRGALYLAIGIVAVWGTLSAVRSLDWRSDVALFESALAANPDMERRYLGTALWNRGDYEKALAQFKKDREKRGTYDYSLYLGRYLFQSGKYRDALDVYQKALSEGAGALKEAHLFIAEAYEKTGSDRLALEHYRKVLRSNSIDPLNEYSRKAADGMNRIRERLSPELMKLRLRAANEQGNAEAQSNLAAFLFETGMLDEAEHFYVKSLELNSSWDSWYNLGQVYMHQDRYKEAVRAFENSLLLEPDNVRAIGNIGVSYMAMQEYGVAARYFERIIDLDSGNLYAAFNLAKIYYGKGDRKNARKYFSLARSLAQGNQALQSNIDNFLKELEY